MKIKVMTYNVLYGLHNRDGNLILLDLARMRAVRNIVRAEKPDILGLTEAVYCEFWTSQDRNRIIRVDYEQLFGLKHSYATGFEQEWGSMILSKFPILHAERLQLGKNHRGESVSAIRATLDVNGKRVHVDVVHPAPKISDNDRVTAFAPLLKTFTAPYLMIGDFNSLSEEDAYDRKKLIREIPANGKEARVVADRMLVRNLIPSVRSHGLEDTLPKNNRTHTIPTKSKGREPKLRLDYIFASRDFKVISSRVIKNKLTETASDHYPVVAELEF
ncbi:endonuclease/exonuclease/phosphatase family protein [Candidatus Woesearchaeota archaeon]|nr:endonuclease/exonuclease/phosphatase family protein [Candidatus Woesearchaeota archaeon]